MDIKVEKHKDGVVTIEGQESAQDYVRFSVLPAYILASKELSANEKLVYCVIYTFNTNEKDFFGSNQFIAQSTGLTAGAVQNILTKLESKKLITRIYVDNNPIKGRAIIRLGQGYHQGMIGLSSDNDTPYHRRVIPLSSESDHTNKDTNKDTNKVKEKKGSANFTRSQFLKEKEQILEEAKKKYPHRDCDKAVSDFIDKTAIKDYNYKNYKLAFLFL